MLWEIHNLFQFFPPLHYHIVLYGCTLIIADLANTFCFSNRIPRLPGVLLRERLEGAGGISSVKTHKRKFKATVSIPDVVEPVELSSQQMDQDFEAEAANIEPVPAPAAVGTAWQCPNFACKGS